MKTAGLSYERDSHPNRVSLPLGPLTTAVNALMPSLSLSLNRKASEKYFLLVVL